MPLTGRVIRTYHRGIMSEEIIKKLNEHDQRFNEHDKRFNEHDKRFDEHDKRFDEHDKRFDQIDKRFDQIDKRFDGIDHRIDRLDQRVDFIARKVLEHDTRLDRIEENMATKADIDRIMNTLDTLVGIFTKTDQELIFMGERVKRVEEKTEKNTQDIAHIQPLVGLR